MTIADFTYNDKSPWPSEAGFAGYSLVLKSTVLPNPDYAAASAWRSSGLIGGNPNASDTELLVGAPDDDDDHDGFNKLLEHALGGSDNDPTDLATAYGAFVQAVEVDDVVNDYLVITHRRNLAADDTVVVPELGSDLVSWSSGEPDLVFVSEVNQGDGTSLVTYRCAEPFDPVTTSSAFLRLRVEWP
jgi:hypothetical protein